MNEKDIFLINTAASRFYEVDKNELPKFLFENGEINSIKGRRKEADNIVLEKGPINISLPIENALVLKQIDRLTKTDYKVSSKVADKVKISLQLAWQVTIQVDFDFMHFPLDIQEIPIKLSMRNGWKLCHTFPANIFFAKEKIYRNIHDETQRKHVFRKREEDQSPQGMFRLYANDDKIVTVKHPNLSKSHLQWQTPDIMLRDNLDHKPSLVIRYSRSTMFYFFNVVLPVFTIVEMALASFLLNRDSAEFRLGSLTTGLLQMVVFLQYTNNLCPDKYALTFSSYYILLSYAVFLLAALKVVSINYLISEDASGLFDRTNDFSRDVSCDKSILEEYSIEECSDMKHSLANWDDISTWILIALPIIYNFVIAIYLWHKARELKNKYSDYKKEEIHFSFKKDKEDT